MTEVAPINMPSLEGKRLSFALAEDRLAHYPEFRDFFVRMFDLDRKGLSEPRIRPRSVGKCLRLHFHRQERGSLSIRS
jgi:hypothetical protein